MDSVEEFLAYSIHLEREAATRFGQLADAMDPAAMAKWESCFRRLSDYCNCISPDASTLPDFARNPRDKDRRFRWPGLESPETAAIWAADPLIGREQALEIALDAETAGFEYYKNIIARYD